MATKKTNVRQHARKTSNSPITVVHHQRNIKVKPTLGYVKLKDLNYKQAKTRYPWIEPNGDIDGDGVVNKKDCHPFDVKRQDDDAQDLIDETEWEDRGTEIIKSINEDRRKEEEEFEREVREHNEKVERDEETERKLEEERIREFGINNNRENREEKNKGSWFY